MTRRPPQSRNWSSLQDRLRSVRADTEHSVTLLMPAEGWRAGRRRDAATLCGREPHHPDRPERHARQPDARDLQPPPARAHHLPRHRGRRRHRQRHLRPAAAPGWRRSRPGRLAVHQQPRRLGHRGHGHLRHDAVHRARRRHRLHGPRRLDGPVPAVLRRQGQALRPAARPHHDAPALGRLPGPGGRHRHPGRAADVRQAAHGRAHRLPHRADRRADLRGLRARPLVHGRAGQGLRHHRRRDRAPGRGRQRFVSRTA